jgi:hypothetical protein
MLEDESAQFVSKTPLIPKIITGVFPVPLTVEHHADTFLQNRGGIKIPYKSNMITLYPTAVSYFNADDVDVNTTAFNLIRFFNAFQPSTDFIVQMIMFKAGSVLAVKQDESLRRWQQQLNRSTVAIMYQHIRGASVHEFIEFIKPLIYDIVNSTVRFLSASSDPSLRKIGDNMKREILDKLETLPTENVSGIDEIVPITIGSPNAKTLLISMIDTIIEQQSFGVITIDSALAYLISYYNFILYTQSFVYDTYILLERFIDNLVEQIKSRDRREVSSGE